MSVGDAIESISVFFNDLIGAVVPASVWAIGIAVMHIDVARAVSAPMLGGGGWSLIAIGVLFAAGHLLLAVYEPINWILVLVHSRMAAMVKAHPALEKIGLEKISGKIRTYDEIAGARKRSYIVFAKMIEANQNFALGEDKCWEPRDLRSIAMTVSQTGEALGRRFMFIALLCRGTGTALVLLAMHFSIVRLIAPESLRLYSAALPWWLQVALLLAAAYLLFIRETTFVSRAMATPFACATAELGFRKS